MHSDQGLLGQEENGKLLRTKHSRNINHKSCLKRHPKTCKWFAKVINRSFGKDCGYSHTNPSVNPENKSLKNKVEYLENIVREMAIKIIHMEIDLDGFKKNENKKESEDEQE